MALGGSLLSGFVGAQSSAAAARLSVSIMHMRLLHLTVTCLGLMLCGFSLFEVARVRWYCSEVREVQNEASRGMDEITEIARKRQMFAIAPSPQSVLARLDASADLERGWWVVCIGGGLVFLVGVVCVFTRPNQL